MEQGALHGDGPTTEPFKGQTVQDPPITSPISLGISLTRKRKVRRLHRRVMNA